MTQNTEPNFPQPAQPPSLPVTSVPPANVSKSSDSFKPSIAIVGTQGCGKTVFITVLAKRLNVFDLQKRIVLTPKDVATLKYIENNWHNLCNGEWPASTPAGKLFDLRWSLNTPNGTEAEVCLTDLSGHDLRKVFADDRIDAADEVPEALRPLIHYCQQADIILFMVNLRDIVGENSAEQRIDNESVVFSAMNHLIAQGKQCALLFTQTDQYAEYVKQHGGWAEYARTQLPNIYGAHLINGKVPFLPVAAVADTTTIQDSDGTSRRVPAEGFQSDGLPQVLDWVVTAIHRAVDAKMRKARASFWKKVLMIALPVMAVLLVCLIVSAYNEAQRQEEVRVAVAKRHAAEAQQAAAEAQRKADEQRIAIVKEGVKTYCKWSIVPGFFRDDVICRNGSNKEIHNVAAVVKGKNLDCSGISSGDSHTWENVGNLISYGSGTEVGIIPDYFDFNVDVL